jgi:hypothetical protein
VAALAAEALEILEETLPADHPKLAVCRGNAAGCAAAAAELVAEPGVG